MSGSDRGLRDALEAAGFDPPDNVCAYCKHLGGNHDLGNWCLLCPRPAAPLTFSGRSEAGWCFFSSMNEDEKWAYGIDRLRATYPEAFPLDVRLLAQAAQDHETSGIHGPLHCSLACGFTLAEEYDRLLEAENADPDANVPA